MPVDQLLGRIHTEYMRIERQRRADGLPQLGVVVPAAMWDRLYSYLSAECRLPNLGLRIREPGECEIHIYPDCSTTAMSVMEGVLSPGRRF